MPDNLTYDELIAQVSALQKQIKYLSDNTQKLTTEVKELKELNKWYLEQLKLSKKKIFGASAEKISEEYGQLNFFNEAEAERTELLAEPEIEEVVIEKHTRKKKSSYSEKYKNLPVEEVIYDVDPQDKICNKCDSEMSFLKYEIRREIKIVPAKVSVVEHKKAVYVCKECDKNGIESNFVSAKATAPLIEKSLVSPSLMAHISNQKFCNAMPLYRQEQEFKRMGIKISRQTMSNWMISGARLLKPLYEIMHKELISTGILHADETTLEVLCEPDRPAQTKSYMWLYRTGQYEKRKVVLYDYREGRSGEYAKQFLQGFTGYLHCDGWHGYDKVENVTRIGCWAHVRRYFKNALDIQTDKTDFKTVAGQGFLKIENLFRMDRSETEIEKLAEIRKNKSKKQLNEFFEWCSVTEKTTLPKSMTGKAVNYALKQKETLEKYIDNPKLEMTNNYAERAIKPFVIGRKNWLFCNTPSGAQSSACIYSIIETAKENGLSPYYYLEWLFEAIRLCNFKKIEDLLPWGEEIPKSIHIN